MCWHFVPPSRGNLLEVPYPPKCHDILTQSRTSQFLPYKSSLDSIPHTSICLIVVVMKVTVVYLRCFPPQVLIIYFLCYIFSHIIIMMHMFHIIIIMQHLFHTLSSWCICFRLCLSYYRVFLSCQSLSITGWSSDSWSRSFTSDLHKIFQTTSSIHMISTSQNSKRNNDSIHSSIYFFSLL